MASRIELQQALETILGSENVYYNPPATKQMEYDAIRYALKNIERTSANDAAYQINRCYEIIVISKRPDPEVVDKLIRLPYCSFDRHYKADNLNHYVFTLYY